MHILWDLFLRKKRKGIKKISVNIGFHWCSSNLGSRVFCFSDTGAMTNPLFCFYLSVFSIP